MRQHITQTESYSQQVTVTREFVIYECDHCDKRWDVAANLGFREIEGEVRDHVEKKHPGEA